MEIEKQSSFILDTVQKFAISPQDVQAIVNKYQSKYKDRRPKANHEEVQDAVAKQLIKRYSRMAATVGATSGLTGVIPGLGTAVAVTAGTTGDIAICMKLEVDMCMCLAQNYDWDITTDDAQHLSFLISAGATLEKMGAEAGTKIASKAGVKLLRKYLKGAALKTIKELFKKIGITFTRKGLEKALPFGIGVVIGGTANYHISKYVGTQARKWFVIDRNEK